jgi:hypothetical protein
MEVELLHEIPVRVMRAADIQYYTPPDVPPPRVQLELPYNKVGWHCDGGLIDAGNLLTTPKLRADAHHSHTIHLSYARQCAA